MKALITGGAGFIGYHLAHELLNHNYNVTLIDNFGRGVDDSGLKELKKNSFVEFLQLDLLEPDSYKKINGEYDIIFHLAAIIGVQNVLTRPEAVLHDNIMLLFYMLEFARKQKNLKRFVFASTSEVYAGTLQYYNMEIPTPESTPLTLTPLEHPRTSYMLSKIYGEAVLRQSEVPFTIIRPHNFYGPRMGMSHVIPELLRKVWFNEGNGKLEVYSPTHRRTFCYITDASAMIRLLAEHETGLNQAFNIGNQEPEVTMKRVGELVLQAVGKSYIIEEKEAAAGSPVRRCPDMQKTFTCTGYVPKIGLEEGIEKTYAWYKAHIFSGNEEGAK